MEASPSVRTGVTVLLRAGTPSTPESTPQPSATGRASQRPVDLEVLLGACLPCEELASGQTCSEQTTPGGRGLQDGRGDRVGIGRIEQHGGVAADLRQGPGI